jgi:transcriptional regulator with XRE-family HTH domain
MADAKKIMDAVRELRQVTGMSQISFAVRLGISYPSVQRYEQVAAPKGESLAKLYYLSREYGQGRLAGLFKDAALEGVSSDLIRLIREVEVDEKDNKEASPARAVDKRRLRA